MSCKPCDAPKDIRRCIVQCTLSMPGFWCRQSASPALSGTMTSEVKTVNFVSRGKGQSWSGNEVKILRGRDPYHHL